MPLKVTHPPDSGQWTRITDPVLRAWSGAVILLAPISGIHATAQFLAMDSPSALVIALTVFIDVAVVVCVGASLLLLLRGVRVP